MADYKECLIQICESVNNVNDTKDEVESLKNETEVLKDQAEQIVNTATVLDGTLSFVEITATSNGQTTFSVNNDNVNVVIVPGGWVYPSSRNSTSFTIDSNDYYVNTGDKLLAIITLQ